MTLTSRLALASRLQRDQDWKDIAGLFVSRRNETDVVMLAIFALRGHVAEIT
jgi:hypothetical protein